MKQFARSIPGKTILFFLTVFFCCAHMAAAHLTVTLKDEGVYNESLSGTTMRAKIWEVDEDYLRDASWPVMEEVLADCLRDDEVNTYPAEQYSIAFQIFDEEGKLIGGTEGYNPNGAATEVHSYWYGVAKGEPSTIPSDAIFIITLDMDDEWDAVFCMDCYAQNAPARALNDQLALWLYSHTTLVPILSIIFAFLTIIIFIWLICVSGRRPHTEEVFPGPLDPLPFDLMLAGSVGIVFLLYRMGRQYFGATLISIMMLLLLVSLGVGNAMSMACRIKRGTLAHNTILYRIGCPLLSFVKTVAERIRGLAYGLPMIWKTALFIGIFVAADLILDPFFREVTGGYIFYWSCKLVVIGPILLWYALCDIRLFDGVKRFSTGELDYHIDTKGMPPDLKMHGELLNGIAEGMKFAVDKEVRSERIKTELLTNVSHDIKTPLTSIINYADLISLERNDSEKVAQYSEVLNRQARRLKRLLEDLVEASKASTGNLEIMLEPTHAGVLLQQAAGEYEERMTEIGLTQVLELPEQDIMIMADGRRMWRIFDNLSNNACKYALSGTRVYIRLEQQGENCVMSFSNVSREPLNISEEELMERFVRGDRARNTEGSGLGLSIARSLVELQHGKMEIKIDGDLFKVVLTFPIVQA